jgi:3-hydroxyisobutyrate dehydrogenase
MAAAQTETVAVLGAGGPMGFPVTRNVTRAGFEVRAWSQSRDMASPLAAEGAYIAAGPADAARGAGIVVTVLADAGAVLAAMTGPDGALSAMEGSSPSDAATATSAWDGPAHAIWLQMSAIGEAATRHCERLANQHGIGFVDAPALGTRSCAEDGKLVVLESGPEEARPRVQPVFDAIGHRTVRAGQAGSGTLLKLVADTWLRSVVEGAVEAVELAEGLGLDPVVFCEAIDGGALDVPLLEAIADRLNAAETEPDAVESERSENHADDE